MPHVYVTSRGRPGLSFACLGSLLAGLAMLVVFAVLAVVLFWVAVVVLGLVLVGTLAGRVLMGVRRIRGQHGAVRGPQGGPQGVIEARVVEDTDQGHPPRR